MTRKSKSRHKTQHRIARKMSRKNDAKTIGNFVAPQSRTLHFKDGCRVCSNCELIKSLGGDLLSCPRERIEMTTEVAKKQRLCRD